MMQILKKRRQQLLEDLPVTTKPCLWGHHCLAGTPSQTTLAPAVSAMATKSIREQMASVTWPLLRYDCRIKAGNATLAIPASHASCQYDVYQPWSVAWPRQELIGSSHFRTVEM